MARSSEPSAAVKSCQRRYAGIMRYLSLAFIFLLVACAAATPPAGTAEPPAHVDYSCGQDNDCAVKNVGNCCGYYPACVNRDSPTFPEQVRAECEKTGAMSVCGWPVIRACACVAGRCETSDTGSGGEIK